MKETGRELFIIIGLSLVVSFAVNAVSPNGIPLLGNWDTAKGVVTAQPTDPDDSLFDEIKDVDTAKELFDRGDSVFVDARHFDSYQEGHIPGAVSLPVGEYSSHIESFRQAYDAAFPIITYCSGRECEDSHKLAQLLLMDGYTNIQVFIDGFPGWSAMGYAGEQ